MPTQRQLILVFLLPLFQISVAQKRQHNLPDSLATKSAVYFGNAVATNTKDSLLVHLYSNAWLAKAKEEKNNEQLTLAYRHFALTATKTMKLKYADSMLTAAKQTKDNLLLGKAYLTKGIIQYDHKNLRKALDNYLLADKYISASQDLSSKYMVKYTIALTKYHLGFYEEAIALFTECLKYYIHENDHAYLNTLHSLGICYNRTGRFDKCSELNAMGIKASREFSNTKMLAYFVNSEGINQASKRNYINAIKMLQSSLPEISKKDDHANQSITWFYLGKSYWELKQPQKALPYLMKVDSVFEAQNYIRTDLRETYEILIDYYKSKNDPHNQLRYINTLLKVDRELTTNHTYLLQKVIKEYDTQKLLQERNKVENTLRFKNTVKSIIIATMAILVVYLSYRHVKTRRKYQQKFRELMEKNTTSTRTEPITMKEAIADISPEVIASVTKNMQRFEQKKEFLQKDLTQVRLASILNTNTRYIPKIVWQNTGKSTIDYVCDLKIDYIVDLLKNDSRARNYTNKALGEEAGFGSTQNFTRAFKSRTGISPTYFIAELKKSIDEGYSE